MRSLVSLLVLLSLVGCKKAESKAAESAEHHASASGEPKQVTMDDVAPLEVPEPSAAAYKPTASEVPLAEDFASAADKRVTVDNYRKELVTIEKELEQLSVRR